MLRGGPPPHLTAAKQKKRLSFKEPEVEEPHFSPSRSFPHAPQSRKLSIENLSLEDQALQVVQSVGSAFSDLSLQDSLSSNYLDIVDSSSDIQDSQVGAYSNDCFLNNEASYHRNLQLQNFRISTEDQEYLEDLSPPLQSTNMRCPPLEMQGSCSSEMPFRNHIPAAAEEKGSSSSSSVQQHQIQLLKYQLEQQGQQTQLALHQVHFLTEQVESECAARRKAQEQNNQLMNQNKELLNHIEKLFQQIEDLEKQIQVLEHDKRVKVPHQDPQGSHQRPSLSFPSPRRLSSDIHPPDKPSPMGRGGTAPPRKTSMAASPRQTTPQHKPTATPAANRKSPATSPRPINVKAKEAALHIGDTSPPVMAEGGTYTPFGSGWKVKAPAEVHQVEAGGEGRSRTGSFSSFSRLKPPETFSSKMSSGGGISGITNKKYSSSTSDLYNSSAGFQSTKPQGLDDSPPSNKSSISNLNLSAPSKLPRFQPYTGRRSSLTKDAVADQFGAMGKDKFSKAAPQGSLYNR